VIPVTVDEIAMLLSGQLSSAEGVGFPRDRHSSDDQAAVITALTADSRTVIPGALFVALRGERVDGHDYVATAAAAGAAASLTRHPVAGALCLRSRRTGLSAYAIVRWDAERSMRTYSVRFQFR